MLWNAASLHYGYCKCWCECCEISKPEASCRLRLYRECASHEAVLLLRGHLCWLLKYRRPRRSAAHELGIGILAVLMEFVRLHQFVRLPASLLRCCARCAMAPE